MEVFRNIPHDAPSVVVEAVWQYSHHVLPGLFTHRGPILTVANWSGRVAGASRHAEPERLADKSRRKVQHTVERGFHGRVFPRRSAPMAERRAVRHDRQHVHPLTECASQARRGTGYASWRSSFESNKAIMGVFDEGCMGMYNAIIPDELLHPTGVFKERLSHRRCMPRCCSVTDEEAQAVREWLDRKGMRFATGRIPRLN